MALPNQDEVEGKFDQTKGSIKEGLGNLTGDSNLKNEGAADRASGHLQEGWGKVKRGVSEVIDEVGDAISNSGKSINK